MGMNSRQIKDRRYKRHGLKGEELKAYNAKYALEKGRTKEGLLTRIYYDQRAHSRNRGHEEPSYTRAEFIKWGLSQDNFEKLYIAWVESDYDKYLRPSADRTDDYTHYTIDNISMTTWRENDKKGSHDVRTGINTKHSKKVFQLNTNGDVINEFHSQSEASRQTTCSVATISNHANGKTTRFGKQLWRF